MSPALKIETLLQSFRREGLTITFPAPLLPYLKSYCERNPVQLTSELIAPYISELPEFTRRVLKTALQVPYGTTVTYKELASMMGAPSAVRAVGTALGRNPAPILIPCHRIVAANGIGGYAFGLELKRILLDFEKQQY